MNVRVLIPVVAVALVATGCATKKYTRESIEAETKPIHGRIDEVETELEETQTRLDQKIDTQGRELRTEIGATSKTAQEALERAREAGKLAQGKFLYETVLTDEKVKFGFESSKVSDEAKAALDEFAAGIKAQNKNVYIEIQGHTDSTGDETYNEELGLERAEAVRRYLSREHKMPLHRMNVISYGEASPVADNGTREGRSQNRRVSLVVLE
jgi:outer membrane protein OmpA-like peptidoglycan-associated protein